MNVKKFYNIGPWTSKFEGNKFNKYSFRSKKSEKFFFAKKIRNMEWETMSHRLEAF